MENPVSREELLEKIENKEDVSNVDTSSITDMNGLFAGEYNKPSLFNQPLNNWDVSKVEDMAFMFKETASFNQPLNDWDVSNVTNADYMFWNAKRYTGSMSKWDFKKINKKSENFMKGCTIWRMYNKSYKNFPSFNSKKPRKLEGVQTV